MPAPIPNSEPAHLPAGDLWQWTRTLQDYPASLYTLKYAFQAQGLPLITVTAGAAADTYSVNVAVATTAGYAPGSYIVTPYVDRISDATERHILTDSVRSITILPSPLAALGTTHASRTLALIEAALEQRIPNGLESTDIDGQQLSRIPFVQLQRLRRAYQAEVSAERNRAAIAARLPNRRTVLARFTSVR